MEAANASRERVVIIGGGFGGLTAAKCLGSTDRDVLLIDRTNHHLFQPLLYQVATAGLAGPDIAFPIRYILRKARNVTVIMDSVTAIDPGRKMLSLAGGREIQYDSLIVATGVMPDYMGNDQWRAHAPPLKTLHDAISIREKVIMGFERAELSDDPAEIERLLTFVVIGGGPTGVELAGAISEIARMTMRRDFRRIDPTRARVLLVEGNDQLLPGYSLKLAQKAKRGLEKIGVEVLTGTRVNDITEEGVRLDDRSVASSNVIWAAGNRAPKLLEDLDAELDRMGRVKVSPDLSVPGHPEIFVIGDAAAALDRKGAPLPGIAPVAIQQAKHVCQVLRGGTRKAFQYFDRGTLATIGRSMAVARIRKLEFNGFWAWLAWLVVHLMFILLFRNRIVVFINWVYNYFTGQRGARIISRH